MSRRSSPAPALWLLTACVLGLAACGEQVPGGMPAEAVRGLARGQRIRVGDGFARALGPGFVAHTPRITTARLDWTGEDDTGAQATGGAYIGHLAHGLRAAVRH